MMVPQRQRCIHDHQPVVESTDALLHQEGRRPDTSRHILKARVSTILHPRPAHEGAERQSHTTTTRTYPLTDQARAGCLVSGTVRGFRSWVCVRVDVILEFLLADVRGRESE